MRRKKLLSLILAVVMIATIMPAISGMKKTIAAADFAITSPGQSALIGAGYFDIKWSASTTSTVKDYKLYIDETLVGTTTKTSYEYYTTDVKMYSAYVTAEYTDGTSKTTKEVIFGVTKKGTCVDNNMGKKLDPKDLNVGWYYNWGTGPSSMSAFKGYDYVPMIWGRDSATNISNKVTNFANQGYKYVLGFNEPDLAGQALMSVDEVINLWPSFLNKNIHAGSPATAIWPNGSKDWFQPFMTRVNATNSNMYVDFIAVHCYPENFQGAGMANWFLEEVVDKTWEMYHKPIWITEFSTTGDSITSEGTIEFLETVMPGLDSRDYVERYSFFSFDAANKPAGLWNHSTGELSEAGEVYAEYGNPEEYEPPIKVDPGYTINTSKKTALLPDTITLKGIECEDYLAKGTIATATATTFNGDYTADKAIDEDFDSRWESQYNDPQSITINLGAIKNIKQVAVTWEDAGASEYKIEVSADGDTYTSVAEVSDNTHYSGKCDTILFSKMAKAQYVRIAGTTRATQYGYSIFDMAIYGTDNEKIDETTTPVPTTKKPAKTTAASVTTTSETNESLSGGSETTKSSGESEITGSQKTTIKVVTTNGQSDRRGQVSKAKISKISSKKKASSKAKISLKSTSGAMGYQIQIAKTKGFKKILVKKDVKKVKFTIKSKKIKNKSKLYVRARAYKIVEKIKYCGDWSKPKKIKIK